MTKHFLAAYLLFASPLAVKGTTPAPSYSHEPSVSPAPSYSHEPSASPAPSESHSPSQGPSASQSPSETPLGTWPNCGTSVRRAWRDLTCDQQQDYLNAVNSLKDDGLYDHFVQVHYANRIQTHGRPWFFPWHRWFLWRYEQALQVVTQSCLTVPYWDWERDSGSEETTSVLDATSFGSFSGTSQGPVCGNGICEEGEDCKSCKDDCLKIKEDKTCCSGGPQGTCGDARCEGENKKNVAVTCSAEAQLEEECVNEGQFQWSATVAGTEIPDWMCLKREFVPGSDFVHEAGLLFRTIQSPVYAAWGPSIEGSPHAIPHNFIGAHMRTHFSPDDPLFYLHHANVDRLWALWQTYQGQDLIEDIAEYDANQDSCCGIIDLQMPFRSQEGSTTGDPYFFLSDEQRTPTMREVMKNFQGDATNVQYDNDRLASLIADTFGLDQLSGGEWVTLYREDMGCGAANTPATRKRGLASTKTSERVMKATQSLRASDNKLRGVRPTSKLMSNENINIRTANKDATGIRFLKGGPDSSKLNTFKSTLKELSKMECEGVPQIVTPEWMAMNGFSSCTEIYNCFYEDFGCLYQ